MADEKLSLAKAQQNSKPKIEEIIHAGLEGDRQKSALELVAYLNTLRMPPKWASTNAWSYRYKGVRMYTIRIRGKAQAGDDNVYKLKPGAWSISCYDPFGGQKYAGEYAELEPCDAYKEVIWNNVIDCNRCCNCAHRKLNILGKEFDGVCSVNFINPDSNTTEWIKKMLECRKRFVSSKEK